MKLKKANKAKKEKQNKGNIRLSDALKWLLWPAQGFR